MNWQSAVERTVTGLGYDLVDADKSAGGLLRVFIDHLHDAATAASDDRFIGVDDCERVTRQLQHVLEVDGCAYERLEVSSPGLDRPLTRAAHYTRFCGEEIEITLKLPFKGRKKYRGILQNAPEGAASAWRLVLSADGGGPEKADRAARRRAEFETAASPQALEFSLEEVREARLVPVIDFKGRRLADGDAPGIAAPASARSDDGVDGGRIQ